MFQRLALSVVQRRLLNSTFQVVLAQNREFCRSFGVRYLGTLSLNNALTNRPSGNFSMDKRTLHTNVPLYDNSSSSSAQQTDWKKLSNEEWAERLSPEAYFCTREGGTEPPFSGQYVNHKAEGVYKCVCCGSDLFTSKTKYDSGSGWPSFYAPAEEEGVIRRKDISHGMVRTEILCASCNSHLGHVFDDGPKPTGSRFCVNSVCLKFAPKKLS